MASGEVEVDPQEGPSRRKRRRHVTPAIRRQIQGLKYMFNKTCCKSVTILHGTVLSGPLIRFLQCFELSDPYRY